MVTVSGLSHFLDFLPAEKNSPAVEVSESWQSRIRWWRAVGGSSQRQRSTPGCQQSLSTRKNDKNWRSRPVSMFHKYCIEMFSILALFSFTWECITNCYKILSGENRQKIKRKNIKIYHSGRLGLALLMRNWYFLINNLVAENRDPLIGEEDTPIKK